MRMRTVLAASATSLALLVPAAGVAQAENERPIVGGLVGPLQFDVGRNGNIYVGQAFAGIMTKITPNGRARTLFRDQGLTGVARTGNSVVYTVNIDPDQETGEGPSIDLLKRWKANGRTKTIANLRRFERRKNPDKKNTYGILGLGEACAAQLPPFLLPAPGGVDSNPYAVTKARGRGWFLADAGANAILRVFPGGKVRTVWVAPPQRTRITAAAAESLELPECTVGKTAALDPVPTDVELGRGGGLVVSLLPGGPEDPSLGARGAVYRVRAGKGRKIADGFLAATNVAVSPRGIYVAELFGNKISLIRKNGRVRTVLQRQGPAAVEFSSGRLYASIKALPPEQGAPDGTIIVRRP